VQPAPSREYGRAMLTVGDADDPPVRGPAPGSCITVAGTVSFQTNYLLAL